MELLTIAEFLYINSVSATTGISPFCLLDGQHFTYQIMLRTNQKVPSGDAQKEYTNKLGKWTPAYIVTLIMHRQYKPTKQINTIYQNLYLYLAIKFGFCDDIFMQRSHLQNQILNDLAGLK